ncbi:hypothetical protein [Nitrosomonas sp. Nm58]|uniref:hypothetical protein n=1 Tax=Nitrosomonas sp. Nm58 TaxID=200126 RepID=UPI000899F81F|nr:hypothetical protein [Nitrosomonas sp. Nm58]SDY37398.1 hypothetical protein SAMN05421754_10081 [Nitrosomonas sp. Nm58]
MRQTELHLTDEDRQLIESYRAKGLHSAREVNRNGMDAHYPKWQRGAKVVLFKTL